MLACFQFSNDIDYAGIEKRLYRQVLRLSGRHGKQAGRTGRFENSKHAFKA